LYPFPFHILFSWRFESGVFLIFFCPNTFCCLSNFFLFCFPRITFWRVCLLPPRAIFLPSRRTDRFPLLGGILFLTFAAFQLRTVLRFHFANPQELSAFVLDDFFWFCGLLFLFRDPFLLLSFICGTHLSFVGETPINPTPFAWVFSHSFSCLFVTRDLCLTNLVSGFRLRDAFGPPFPCSLRLSYFQVMLLLPVPNDLFCFAFFPDHCCCFSFPYVKSEFFSPLHFFSLATSTQKRCYVRFFECPH